MINEVIARIDVTRPSGLRIARELKKRRAVKIEYPLPEDYIAGRTYTHEEFWKRAEKQMNEHYGTDYKLKIRT